MSVPQQVSRSRLIMIFDPSSKAARASGRGRALNARSMLLGALMTFAFAPAWAQSGSPISVIGSLEKIDATSVSLITGDDRREETFGLAPNLLVLQNKTATLADIKPNNFVASAAMRGADGKLHSTELRIFPDAMRGLGEGQRPMNDTMNRTMTNATVTGTAIVNGSNNITVKFEGGESELILDPGVPVTRIEEADKSLLKAGMKVRVQGRRNTDGTTVNRITIQ